jgi:hypothetical protein
VEVFLVRPASKLFYPLYLFLAGTLAVLLVPLVAAAEPQAAVINPVGDFGVEPLRYREPGEGAGDSDSSVETKRLWDDWHKRVSLWISVRFNKEAQNSFKGSSALHCRLGYMVARDGRVGNIRVLESSGNPLYDTMLVSIIKSLAHDPVLSFPPNSRREFVEKSGTFDWKEKLAK